MQTIAETTARERLAAWLSTPEGRHALDDTVARATRLIEDLRAEREVDARAIERPMTI